MGSRMESGLLDFGKKKQRKGERLFFYPSFSLMNTRSVDYEKTKKDERLFYLSFFSLMKRSKNHPTT